MKITISHARPWGYSYTEHSVWEVVGALVLSAAMIWGAFALCA
jgi:hypothetical protein